jgi:hypothetical protein
VCLTSKVLKDTLCFCLAAIVDYMTDSNSINYKVMAHDDDYDPTKPEYITPAKQDEMEHTSSELLGRQIAQLEMFLEKRVDVCNSPSNKFQHYDQVLAEMRQVSNKSK